MEALSNTRYTSTLSLSREAQLLRVRRIESRMETTGVVVFFTPRSSENSMNHEPHDVYNTLVSVGRVELRAAADRKLSLRPVG
jgi:hypothetical protein